VPPAPLQRGPDNPGGLPVEAYDYDAVHNRIASAHQPGAWDYDANNRLLGWGSGTARTLIEYDDNGQTIAETRAGVRTEYGYGAAERLIEVRRGGGLVARYAYDPFGRRIAKDVTGQGVTWFVYAEEGLLAELDANGSAKRLYGWQPDTMWGTAPLHQSERLGQGWDTHALHVDHLGTPQRATEASGTVSWTVWMEGFGTAYVESTYQVQVNLRLPGQYFDAESGSIYNYFRSYNSQQGRYYEADPIGLWGGVNTYSYVSASPLSNSDPRGLDCVAVGATVNCFVGPDYGGGFISFPRPEGWPDYIVPLDRHYHFYDKFTELPPGVDEECISDWVRKNPTPWPGNPATAEGAPNQASPPWIRRAVPNPVLSYATTYKGAPAVVNVTQPGHRLFPGYVLRVTIDGVAHNFGEGTGALQGPSSPTIVADAINNAWYGATDAAIKACSCSR